MKTSISQGLCFQTAASWLTLLTVFGCGSSGLHPVNGYVKFPDGQPLPEGEVVCETTVGTQPVMARGILNSDGSFSLGTNAPGDGAPPGKYRVLVSARALTAAEQSTRPPFIDPKFSNFESSGLSLEVKPGKNVLNITVEKPRGDFQPAPQTDDP